ncbi:MAG: hypothetical protein GY804_12360 [Alphaproteobacteria bacterium]|nr:hypothetical protein [Alphaproteobacteria bacterium]
MTTEVESVKRLPSGITAKIMTDEGELTIHQAPKKEGGEVIGYLDQNASKTSGFDFAGSNIKVLEGNELAAEVGAIQVEDLTGKKRDVTTTKKLIAAVMGNEMSH